MYFRQIFFLGIVSCAEAVAILSIVKADAGVFLIFINVTFFVYGCKDIGSVYL